MSEDKTAEMPHLPSFEERVLAQLDNVGSRLAALEKKVTEIDFSSLHKAFSQMHEDMKVSFRNFDRKLDVINSEMLQLKADQKGIESRVDKIELEVHPQIIVQDRQF